MAGLAAGWAQRAIIFRYSVPSGEPPRQCCPACGLRLTAASPGQSAPARAFPGGRAAARALPGRPPLSPARALPGRPPLSPARALPGRLPLSPAGRCPGCRQRIGPHPLAVEVTSALLLGALAVRVHPGLVLAAACWLALCAVPLAFIDAAVRRLPDALTGLAFTGIALILLAAAAASGQWNTLARALLGGVVLAGFYLVLALVSPSGMGLGDVKAAASLGTMLAWRGWTALIAGGLAGFVLAAVYGIVLLISGRATRKQQVPFGPFMITAALLVLLAPA